MTETYLLTRFDGEVLSRRDTWQGAAEDMAEYSADEQRHMLIIVEPDD